MNHSTALQDAVHAKTVDRDCVVESARRLPIRHDVDVVVCGAGPAGIGAALAAAREGAEVLLVEQHGQPGGVWTAGLLNPFFECMGRGWIVDELVERLKTAGSLRPWMKSYTFDVEIMRLMLEQMLSEAGVECLYYTMVTDAVVEDGRLRGVVLESKSGREAVRARTVIDATGDGDVAARAGCPYELGRPGDGFLQPMTLMFEIHGLGDWEHDNAPALFDKMSAAIERHDLDVKLPFGRVNYAPWIIATPTRGVSAVQATHVYGLNPLDPKDLTAGTCTCRRQAADMIKVFRHIPGLEGVRMGHTAAQLGIREARRVRGRYQLTRDDLVAGRRFEDAVASCAFVVDIHDPAATVNTGWDDKISIQPYEIPYGCLVPETVDGLLTAGRCISGSHEAHASYRVTGTAMATGQAAGLAAAWAAAERCEVSAVPGRELKSALVARGARMADTAEASV